MYSLPPILLFFNRFCSSIAPDNKKQKFVQKMVIHTVKSADTPSGQSFIREVHSILASEVGETARRVACDCEGVNLCRLGSVEIISICFPTLDIYLIDFGGTVCPGILKSTTDLFKSASVIKVIHDCCMDCDALYHLHGVQVNNVHDASYFHGVEDSNLNDVLSYWTEH